MLLFISIWVTGWIVAVSVSQVVFASIYAGLLLGSRKQQQNAFQLMLLGAICLLVYWGGAILSTIAIETGMQNVLARNRANSSWINARTAFYYLPSLVLSHLVSFRAIAGATFRIKVSCRGIDYQFSGVKDIQMLNYQPFLTEGSPQNPESII